MEFDEIGLVIPGIELALEYGYGNLNQPQKYFPRMFRSHMAKSEIPEGFGKTVVVLR